MTNYIEQANQQQISIETKITPELLSDVPVNWVGGSRWTFDRGAMPGEPFAFLDGDNETSTAAMVEIQTPGRPVFLKFAKLTASCCLGLNSQMKQRGRQSGVSKMSGVCRITHVNNSLASVNSMRLSIRLPTKAVMFSSLRWLQKMSTSTRKESTVTGWK